MGREKCMDQCCGRGLGANHLHSMRQPRAKQDEEHQQAEGFRDVARLSRALLGKVGGRRI